MGKAPYGEGPLRGRPAPYGEGLLRGRRQYGKALYGEGPLRGRPLTGKAPYGGRPLTVAGCSGGGALAGVLWRALAGVLGGGHSKGPAPGFGRTRNKNAIFLY